MEFSDHEKARIKHFASYPDWTSLSNSIQLGFPAGSQPLYLIEQSFDRLTDGGKDSVRRDLCECESIEKQLSGARKRMTALELGKLKMNPNESMQLRRELLFWTLRLVSDLGVITNPYAAFEALGGGGDGRNARVVS